MLDRCAGVLIPLFSLRSIGDFGRGEIGGLLPMGDLALAMGHRLIQLLPIDETAPSEASPYSALSVFAIDPIYVSAHGLPGIDADVCAAVRKKIAAAPDRVSIRAAKAKLLERSWRYFEAHAGNAMRGEFDRFVAMNRGWLGDYALFRALKDHFNFSPWKTWPDDLKNHNAIALRKAARGLAEHISRLKYFQFAAHRQWAEVRAALRAHGVIIGGDLAFSPCRESAEVWAHQEMFDPARSAGAPPDGFSATGQRWGLPMPDWKRIRADGFELIRMRVRHARDLYDALRVDHVVGLFRTYGYPIADEIGGRFDPSIESDQRAQGEEILRVIMSEAGSMQIIAEDLGVIPPFVSESLATLGLPGYKIARWEKEKTPHGERIANPATYPAVSLATTGTHDTETLAEWWAKASVDQRRDFVEGLRIFDRADPASASLLESTLDAVLESIYAAPSQMVIVPIQDLFGWTERINLPGTVSDKNWLWRLPFNLEQFNRDSNLRERIAKICAIAERTGRFRRQASNTNHARNVD